MPNYKRKYLPYGRQEINDEDVEAVLKVLRGDFLTTGPTVKAFEADICRATSARFAISCTNGTSALHLAAMALGLGKGDHVIVPTITFLATANAVRYCDAEVIFADVDPDTGLMGPQHLAEALKQNQGKRISAVFPVHLNGQCGDQEKIYELAKSYGLTVVDDAAHAIGTEYMAHDKLVAIGSGTHADMTAFSFHAVKTIAMGEGGAITTNNAEYAERLETLRSHGIIRDPEQHISSHIAVSRDGTPNPWYYEMQELGYNYRLTDIQCALGISQLKRLAQFKSSRQFLMAKYHASLSQISQHVKPIMHLKFNSPAWHLCVALIDFEALGFTRAKLMGDLQARGIGTQVHYIPVHLQPYYQARYNPLELPGAMEYYRRALSLPLFSGMTEIDVEYVIDSLDRIINSNV